MKAQGDALVVKGMNANEEFAARLEVYGFEELEDDEPEE